MWGWWCVVGSVLECLWNFHLWPRFPHATRVLLGRTKKEKKTRLIPGVFWSKKTEPGDIFCSRFGPFFKQIDIWQSLYKKNHQQSVFVFPPFSCVTVARFPRTLTDMRCMTWSAQIRSLSRCKNYIQERYSLKGATNDSFLVLVARQRTHTKKGSNHSIGLMQSFAMLDRIYIYYLR